MNNDFSLDLNNAIVALKHFIIEEEQRLIDKNAGDFEWNYLQPFESTLQNFQYMNTIYGNHNEKY